MYAAPRRRDLLSSKFKPVNIAPLIYEGDYGFWLPATPVVQPKRNREKTMKTKSEPVSKSKGNGSPRQSRRSGASESSSGNYDCPREQMIAEAAYFHAERRGFSPGNELSDWFQAEADVEGVRSSDQ